MFALILAAALAPCVDSGSYDALRECHRRERDALVESMLGKTVDKKNLAQLKALDRRHRSEEKSYRVKNPGSELAILAEAQELKGTPTEAASAGAIKPQPEGDGLAELKTKLEAASPKGSRGITPEMAAQVRDHLLKKQGFISPQMEQLLRATASDGVNLSHETMRMIQDAAREAKGAGLDLGVDERTEKMLLDRNATGEPGAL